MKLRSGGTQAAGTTFQISGMAIRIRTADLKWNDCAPWRERVPVSLLLSDIDRLERSNDAYGHCGSTKE